MFNWPWRRIPFDGLTADDIVIVLIGPTGVGKSTFINTATKATNETMLKVHASLSQCSNEITHVAYTPTRGGRKVVFVDTPAFPDPETTKLTERKVEEIITKWLKKAFASKTMKVAGILYLYRITDRRITTPPRPHMDMINNLCGGRARALLVTTMWEKVAADVGERRKDELSARWPNGSDVVRHDGTYGSAWRVVAQLLGEDIQPRDISLQYYGPVYTSKA
ncbi:hypothetical protein B0H34DRAFT_796924 [Crassisporium funariophilum]|nr:hypothetical protein B0H34DRAFT_796924 [Crassisporium funariophilum]